MLFQEKKYDSSSPFSSTNPIGLVEILAEPLQRLTRYDLLWRELIKNSTKNDPDIQILTQTLHSIYELVTRMELNINAEPEEEKMLRFFLKIANHPVIKNKLIISFYLIFFQYTYYFNFIIINSQHLIDLQLFIMVP